MIDQSLTNMQDLTSLPLTISPTSHNIIADISRLRASLSLSTTSSSRRSCGARRATTSASSTARTAPRVALPSTFCKALLSGWRRHSSCHDHATCFNRSLTLLSSRKTTSSVFRLQLHERTSHVTECTSIIVRQRFSIVRFLGVTRLWTTWLQYETEMHTSVHHIVPLWPHALQRSHAPPLALGLGVEGCQSQLALLTWARMV